MPATGPTVMRLRKPRWRDPRLIVGIVLVLVSVMLGALLVTRLAATTTVMAARVDIVPGDEITADMLTTVDVRLGDREHMYVSSMDQVPDGSVATQTVRAGELVAASTVGQAADVQLRPVVIPVDSAVAESVTPGGTVELWRTSNADNEQPADAEMLIDGAVVRRVDEGSAIGMQSMTVEVLVPRDDVSAILEALGEDGRLDVIGVPGAEGVAA